MKLVCLNLDNCGEVYFLTQEDYKTFNLNEKFHRCFDCSALALLVNDDFFFSEEKSIYINMYLSLTNRENNDN